MRIPSQFNQDNLYRRDRPRSDSGDSLRRVIRMAVALVLLIFVMRQAAEPRTYEAFFGAEPETELETPEPATVSHATARSETQQQRVQDLPVSETCRSLAIALTDAMSVNEQRQWTTVLARWNSGRPFPLMESMADQATQLLSDLVDLDEAERERWDSTIGKFGTIYGDTELKTGDEQPVEKPVEVQEPENLELSDGDAVRLVTWLAALDSSALDRVEDGVWRSPDFDAFYLQLNQAGALSSEGAVSVAVVPLLQQPEIYRGQRVRVSGMIGKADQMPASANPHGIDDYWQLWVIPDTGGDRPIVFVVPDLPSEIRQKIRSGGRPRVGLVGRYFKGLAYRSQLGADLAPVVIGRLVVTRTATKPVAASASDGQSSSNRGRFLFTLMIASVIGISVAAVAIWRTSVAAKRSRELRAQRQHPEQFFDDLNRAEFKDAARDE